VGARRFRPEPSVLHAYQGALGASWQLDLFGRVGAKPEAAQAQRLRDRTRRSRRRAVGRDERCRELHRLLALDRQLEISNQTALELR
jgi:outer membrane protein TolC